MAVLDSLSSQQGQSSEKKKVDEIERGTYLIAVSRVLLSSVIESVESRKGKVNKRPRV